MVQFNSLVPIITVICCCMFYVWHHLIDGALDTYHSASNRIDFAYFNKFWNIFVLMATDICAYNYFSKSTWNLKFNGAGFTQRVGDVLVSRVLLIQLIFFSWHWQASVLHQCFFTFVLLVHNILYYCILNKIQNILKTEFINFVWRKL